MSEYNSQAVVASLPNGSIPVQPSSSSKYILSKRLKRFLSNQQTNFAYAGNDRIEIDINDSTSFIDTSESYLKFKLTVTDEAGNADSLKALDVGGAHSLFNRLVIKTGSGAVIEQLDRYNLRHSVRTHVMDSPEYVEFVKQAEGDSMTRLRYSSAESEHKGFDDSGRTVAAVGVSTITLSAGAALPGHVTGSTITVRGKRYFIRTASGADPNVLIVSPAPDASIVGGAVFYGSSGINDIVPARLAFAQTEYTVCVKLDSGFLQSGQLFPLPMMKDGFRLELTLENPVFALVSELGASPTYQISNVEFMGMMVDLDRTIIDQYKELYNKSGLAYPFLTSRYEQLLGQSSTAAQLKLHSSVRNAVSLQAVVTDNTLIIANQAAQQADSLSSFLKSNLVEHELQVGSERYPYYGKVIEDAAGVESYKLLRRSFQSTDMGARCRILPSEWRGAESKKFILGYDLSREDGDFYAGVDLTNENAILDLRWANSVERYVHCFVNYSSTLNISKDGSIVRH
jgi:hypothetical protein